MQLIIMDTNFVKIGEVESTSVIWHMCYNKAGDFEVYTSATKENVDLLKHNHYVLRNDNSYVGIIEDVTIENDIENGDYIIVTGGFIETLLGRRIVEKQTILNGNMETELMRLIRENVTAPTAQKRKIDEVVLANAIGIYININAQFTGDEILSVISTVCEANDVGFRMKLDQNKFKFEFYVGTDRSRAQNINDLVIFSHEFDNLSGDKYYKSTKNHKNTAYVAGEGEGTDRKILEVGQAYGINRRETFIDARDLSSNDGEISSDEYQQMLDERGREKLSETQITEFFEGNVQIDINYKYNRDYFLGDVVTVENKKYGVSTNMQIIEILECEDENGYQIIPTFGI